MKIAMIDPSLFTAPYDEALCLALQELGHDVTLYSRPRHEDDPPDPPQIASKPLFYRCADAARGLYEPLRLGIKGADHVVSSLMLLKALEAERPDVIHFQWTPFPAVDRLFLPQLAHIAPLVLTVHDTRPFNGRASSPLQKIGASSIYSHFDRLIVHTHTGKERLCDAGAPPSKIYCIGHGPLIPDCLGCAGAFTPIQTQDERKITVLLVGKLKPYKGTDVLVRAVAMLPEPVRNRARFVIAGKPYMNMDEIYALCEQEGVVSCFDFDLRFLPEETLAQYLERASILVFPYREIEASGVLFAALRWGHPIVASALGAFNEMLEDGVHGHLVAPEDPAALAKALEHLILDGRARYAMGHATATLHETIPSWNNIARETAELYETSGDRIKSPAPAAILESAA